MVCKDNISVYIFFGVCFLAELSRSFRMDISQRMRAFQQKITHSVPPYTSRHARRVKSQQVFF